jgi:ketosteroid isomerase-like protein
MSEESTTPGVVERTRIILDAAGREDWDTILSFYDPDAVWHSADGMETLKGPTAIRGFFEDWWSSYERLDLEVSEVLDFGNGVVFAPLHIGGRPRESAAEVHTEMALVYEWEHSAVVRVTSYFDVDEARVAAERLAGSSG